MRVAGIILGLGTSFTVVAAVASGCGGSTSASNPNDSGAAQDVTVEAEPEAAAETGPEAMADVVPDVSDVCVPDANLNNLQIPDAALGDSGANAGACVACLQTACPAVITQCNMSCACVSAFQTFAACVAAGGGLQTCAQGLLSVGTGISVQQLICAVPCASTCGVTIPADTGTPDSGTTEAGDDGGSDAAGD